MVDKSKKVGRFRRRDRGVSHVFAIFFCGTNFSAISFPATPFLTRIVSSSECFSTNQPRNIYRRFATSFKLLSSPPRRIKSPCIVASNGDNNNNIAHEVSDEWRDTFDLSSTTERFDRFVDRFDTWNNQRRISTTPTATDECSRHCFHARTQKLDDAHN